MTSVLPPLSRMHRLLRFSLIFLALVYSSAKMKLFASFDAKVDGHNAVLDGREKTLEAVKGRLVQESANVLGNAR